MRTISLEDEAIGDLVEQHADELAWSFVVRRTMVTAPEASLLHIERLDERITGNVEGLVHARAEGLAAVRQLLDRTETGSVFAVALTALEVGALDEIDRLASMIEATPPLGGELVLAMSFADAIRLRGVAVAMLESNSPLRRAIGLEACAAHGVDPGLPLTRGLDDDSPHVRIAALRVAMRLGCTALKDEALSAWESDEDENVRVEGLAAAVLLGARGRLPAAEQVLAVSDPAARFKLAALLVKASPASSTHELLSLLSRGGWPAADMIRGCGIAGDPRYVPWLLNRMEDPTLARCAGEAFSIITGLDLAKGYDLVTDVPVHGGPSDDPQDELVSLSDDAGLPYPNSQGCGQWWMAQRHRFTEGQRFFRGVAVSAETATAVLREGMQRDRIAAAQWLSLLNPGTPLFDTAAPAWRQWLRLGG